MNFTTYFARGQKVFLINTSPDRDSNLFEAFSATIVTADNHQFVLRSRYPLHQGEEHILKPGMSFKLTTESYGSGVQLVGTIHSVSGRDFIIHPTAQLEMYQRSQVPRMDTILDYRTFTRSASLTFFRQEWERYQTILSASSTDKLEMTSGEINLGIGGFRHIIDKSEPYSDLAMVFIDLEPGSAPICAVAELLWRRSLPDEDRLAIGQRFILIRKSDQDRIQALIQHRQKKQTKKTVRQKNNWELLDRMFHD
jgi:hypothetical protein